MRLQKFIISGILFLLLFATILLGKEAIKASAVPNNTQISSGQTIEIPVKIDLSAFSDLALGSFTASLQWDPQVLRYEGFSGGTTSGFDQPVVNTADTDGGLLTFAHANPYGAKGVANVLNLQFRVVGNAGSSASITLMFSAMAAAKTFNNLLPYLDAEAEIEQQLQIVDTPQEYSLDNYPNPFNPSTVIRYQLPEAGKVKVIVFNVLGQKVRALVNKKQPAGKYTIEWNGRNDQDQMVPSGMYFLRMQAGSFIGERKLLFLK